MSLNTTLQEILNSDTVDDVFKSLQTITVGIGGAIAIFAFGVNVAWNFGKKQISMLDATKVEEIKVIDFDQMVRAIVIFIVIGMFGNVSSFLSSSVDSINSMSTPKMSQQQEMVDNIMESYNAWDELSQAKARTIVKAYAENPERFKEQAKKRGYSEETIGAVETIANSNEGIEAVAEDGRGWMEAISASYEYMSHPSFWILDLLNALSEIILGVLRVVLTFVSTYTFKFLLCIGPLAFAFSLFSVFKNQINTWISSTLNMGLVITTLNFLDHLVYQLTARINNSYWQDGATERDWNDTLAIVALNFVIIGLYLSAFWLTSKFVGTGDGGKVMANTGMAIGGAIMGAKIIKDTTKSTAKGVNKGINAAGRAGKGVAAGAKGNNIKGQGKSHYAGGLVGKGGAAIFNKIKSATSNSGRKNDNNIMRDDD